MSQQADDIKRVYWHSRRGMLELDLILVPFVENCYAQLPDVDKECYKRLLSCEDTDMFAWFLKRQRPDDPELTALVERIIAYSRDAGDSA